MNPEVVAHLLSLCKIRHAELTGSLRLARAAGIIAQSPQATSLMAELYLNSAAIDELEHELQVTA